MLRKFDGFTKGINLGGWLSQCDLSLERKENFIKEEDIAKIKEMGLDHVRLPIDFELVENERGEETPEGYVYIDRCISWCRKYGLNMVLDLHKTAGYVFDHADECGDFFHSRELQERFLNLWNRLAGRYAKEKDMLAFEILNEVVDPEMAEVWNDIAAKAIEIIRKHDKDIWILLGGTRNNNVISIKELRAPADDHIVFNFHCYDPLIFTHQGAYWIPKMDPEFRTEYPKSVDDYIVETQKNINEREVGILSQMKGQTLGKNFFREFFKEAAGIAQKYDVPLYCGEYGVIDLADPEAALNWFEDIHAVFEEYGISRSVWSYKEMDFGLTDAHYEKQFDAILKCL